MKAQKEGRGGKRKGAVRRQKDRRERARKGEDGEESDGVVI